MYDRVYRQLHPFLNECNSFIWEIIHYLHQVTFLETAAITYHDMLILPYFLLGFKFYSGTSKLQRMGLHWWTDCRGRQRNLGQRRRLSETQVMPHKTNSYYNKYYQLSGTECKISWVRAWRRCQERRGKIKKQNIQGRMGKFWCSSQETCFYALTFLKIQFIHR